jgi:hypothetical protein
VITGHMHSTRTAARNWNSALAWREISQEKTLNWLALGLLLAAWNCSDDAAVITGAGRPPELQNHAIITARVARGHAI